jgi:imidazolonepropionase-like amidohydrolase
VHSFYINYLPLYVANGVTSVRDMGGVPEAINKFRKDIKEGKVVGPRILMAGFIVDGPQPIWPFSVKVANEADGRRAVIEQKQRGVDFIKVYSLLSRESYLAIADEAKKQGMTFAGHVPFAVGVAEASDAGQKSIEHLTGVLLGCSSKEDEMLKEMVEASASPNARVELFRISRKHAQTIFDTYSEQKAAGLFARFAKNGTYHVPTLTILRAVAFMDDSSFTNDPRLKYIPPFLKSSWDPKNDFRFRNRKPEDIEHAKKTYQKNLEIVGAMRRAGVQFLAGTDVANPFIFPGFSLHDELSLLVKSGLTPMEALQAATINPAKYFGLTDSLGTIEKGKIADLVLLEANPLEDISNTQKIAAVVMGGKLFDKAYITETLAKIEASTAVK